VSRLLLVSVFAAYGVKNEYDVGRGMQMELLDNQVTREQGIHSPRTKGAYTYALYLLAQNISVPTVVLDFPRWSDFVKELRGGYTHVGISFISQNILKARRMAQHIRDHHPNTTIILGGAGANLPDAARRVPCDEICCGEGVRWLRRYFGEDEGLPLRRSVFSGPQTYYVYGCRVAGMSSSVFPGVGCPNHCDFCATTHKFGRKYIPFIGSGKEMLDLISEEEETFGVREFTIQDENFLKHRKLAEELLVQMEKRGKAYTYFAFASAEAVADLGVAFIVRLGVRLVWIGVESKACRLKKLRNVDLRAMVAALRANGVSVLGSSILFFDHHDRDTILEDIDWLIHLETDLAQFVALTPCPGTPLFERLEAQGRMPNDYPYHEQTGLDRIPFRHPAFRADEARAFIDLAFRRNFEVNGPGVLNLASTSIKGLVNVGEDCARREAAGLSWDAESLSYTSQCPRPGPDPFMKLRLAEMRRSALSYRPLLQTMRLFAPNGAARQKCEEVAALYDQVFGPATVGDRMRSAAVLASAVAEAVRTGTRRALGKGRILHQPPMVRREYNAGDRDRQSFSRGPGPAQGARPLRRAPHTRRRGTGSVWLRAKSTW
jgi:hypothetical protein